MKGLLFTYLMTYGGGLMSLFNPYWGFLIYVCFAIIKPESLWHWSVPQGNYSRIIAIALLLGWSMKGFGSWRLGKAGPMVACLIGFLLWMALSTARTPIGVPAWPMVESLAKVILPVIVGLTLIDSVVKVQQLAWVILLSQAYVALEFNLAYFGGFNALQAIGFGGMDNNCVAIALVTATGFAFFLGLYAKKHWHRALAFGSALVMTHAVMFSFSRGGVLGLIVTGGVSFLLIPKKPVYYLFLVVAILIGIRMAGPEVQKRFSTTFASREKRDGSAQHRIEFWGYCVKFMQKEPLLGIGTAQFPDAIVRDGWHNKSEAHNLWLQLGAENGLPCLLMLALFYLICMFHCWRLLRSRDPTLSPELKQLATMVFASLVGFLVTTQFVSLVGLELGYFVTLVGAGVIRLSGDPQQRLAQEAEFEDDEDAYDWEAEEHEAPADLAPEGQAARAPVG